ncbi:MAG TPA: potassium channel protein [Longimicrobium sp.]|uniref:potassium channel family protein n=1 Tax=Longimicrobium sp. TaxID=2029185 RepID=UPI002ED997EC
MPSRRPRRRRPHPPQSRTWGHHVRAALEDPLRQFQLSLAVLILLVAVGTVGYHLIERMGWINALYMTVITVATVGFGEIEPLTATGRMFTMGLIVLGVGVGAWAASNLVEVALGQTLWTSVQRRKMKDSLSHLRDHYVVCGYGQLGTRIVRDLAARGETFVVVDHDPSVEESLLHSLTPHLIGDATQDDVLKRVRVDRARGLVSALDSDANNVLTVLTAREMNPRLLIVARANAETSQSKLRRAGADRVVTPDDIGGHRLALALLRPAVHDLFNEIFSFGVDISVDVGQITIPENSPFAGQTVAGCDLRRMRNVTILAVRGPTGEFALNPDAQRVLRPGETMIVIGPAEAIYELEAMYGEE